MEILNQFGINPVLLAAQVVNFLVLLLILKKFMYKPLLKVLQERKQKIADSLKNAEEIERKLLETEEEKDKIIVKASKDAQKIVEDTKKEMEALKQELQQAAQEQAEQIIKRGEEAARAEAEKMQQEIMARVAEVVAVGMEKVTGRVLNKSQKEIIDRSMKNLS